LCQVIAQRCTPLNVPVQPFSTASPLFEGKKHQMEPTRYWGNFDGPYPTNSFFTNVAVMNVSDPMWFPIAPLPYHVLVKDTGMQVSFPSRVVRKEFVMAAFVPNIELHSVEATDYQMDSHDLLSVTILWKGIETMGRMKSSIVRGSPFVTMQYEGLTPKFSTIHAILSVNGNGQQRSVSGTQFSVQMNNGQTWKIYSTENNTLSLDWNGSYLTATSQFTGTLRLALIENEVLLSALDSAVETIPVGANVDVTYSECGGKTVADVIFNWRTIGGPAENLLMMALPHHMQTIQNPTVVVSRVSRTMKGLMTGIKGNSWTLRESLTDIKWFAPKGIEASKKDLIIAALDRDQNKRAGYYAPYWNGKELSAMGRLALIADELGNATIAEKIRSNLKTDLDVWLTANNSNHFVYDTTWKGICTKGGMDDINMDFGNAWYNDHHFHYGYFIYAAAVLGKEDREWFNLRKDRILDLLRDYANPSKEDTHFPITRNKDWFDGHSWASGLFGFGDSKNQESTSEATNAYYGIYLLGEALGDQKMSLWGRLLLATELRSVHNYWQMKEGSEIYEPLFAANKVVGVLWSTKVDHLTFFGNNSEYIFGIQAMPYTPISEEHLEASWLREAYPVWSQVLQRSVSDDWKALIYLAHSILDKEAAWTETQSLRYFDNGNTMTNSLYFVATR